MQRIGLDIGKCIIGPTVDGVADTSFLGRTVAEAMHTPPAPHSFDVIARLAERYEVWIVSKCGPSVQRKSRLWLAHHDFHGRTGIGPERLRFCLKRHEKRYHAEELGFSAFVDDRTDVLRHLVGVVPRRLLFGEQKKPVPDWVTPVADWHAVEAALG